MITADGALGHVLDRRERKCAPTAHTRFPGLPGVSQRRLAHQPRVTAPDTGGSLTPMPAPTLLEFLRERAGLQPDDKAFTFTDYDQDWAGVAETPDLGTGVPPHPERGRRGRLHGAVGDRAVILAPQGLDYIAAFLGAMQAGFTAVPLSVPQVGSHDERVSAVLADTSPTVILTTKATAPSRRRIPRRLEVRHRPDGRGDRRPRPGRPQRVRAARHGTHRRPPTCSTPRARRGCPPASCCRTATCRRTSSS